MRKTLKYTLFLALIFTISCKQKPTAQDKSPLPLVKIIQPSIEDIQETEQINGQVIYLNKNTVTSPITGYVQSIKKSIGDKASKGELLYTLQTKEGVALQNSNPAEANNLGIVKVFAGTSGYISSLVLTATGDFVTEGSAMATIVESNNALIQVNAPFENVKNLINKQIIVELPDKTKQNAVFYKSIPAVDAISQTQQLFFKLKTPQILPENLNVIVYFKKAEKHDCLTLPKDAILSNETQDEFWVMKLTNDSLAVKIPIEKGLESNVKVEILKPALALSDKIIKTGAYGLADSTKVKVVEQ